MNTKLNEIQSLINRQEQVVHMLFAEHHPELDRIAQSMATSIQQTRSILEVNQDTKLLAQIRSGYAQGWRELPGMLASIRDVNVSRLIMEISALKLGSKP
jgi:hypothetical protein